MLVQPTHVVPAGGTSGHDVRSLELAMISTNVANLRDELTNGEVNTAQAASRLTALLATLSDHCADTPTSPRRFALPRWTFGGYCTNCLAYACQDPACTDTLTNHWWRVCPDCKGSGYRDIDYLSDQCDPCDRCDCTFGAVETTVWDGDDLASSDRHLNPGDVDRPVYTWPIAKDGRFVNSLSRSGL